MCQWENDYKKSPKGRYGANRPFRCKCQPSQHIQYDISRRHIREREQPLARKQTVNDHQLDVLPVSVTALSVVTETVETGVCVQSKQVLHEHME